MKTFLSITCFLAFTVIGFAQQDGFRLGAHGALPIGKASDVSSFNVGADASYLWQVHEIVAIGVATGYSTYLGKKDFDNYSFVPVAFSGRVKQGESLFYTADVGYAIALQDGADGGLYYQGKIGWTNSKLDIFIFYKGVSSDGNSLDCIGAGLAFKI
ncbi:MAG: hypothetical protein V4581_05425 [Bacteroidota bacterium]